MSWSRTFLLLALTALATLAEGTTNGFFDPGTVHEAVLTFQSDQWRVLEPKERDPVANPSGPSADELRDLDFGYAHADLELDGTGMTNVAVRYKGHGTYRQSRATLKRPFKVDLNEFVRGRRLSGAAKFNFNNNVADPSFMNEAVAYSLYREAGVPAPLAAHVRLSVTVPGRFDRHYLGLYTLVENPDQNWAESRFGTRRVLILKTTSNTLFSYLGEEWSRYRNSYDPRTAVHESQARRVIDFSKLVSQADDPAFEAQLPEYLDLEAFARFLAVTVGLSSLDSILGRAGNFIVYLDPVSNRFCFAPWDLDQAFGGSVEVGTQEQRERLSLDHPWVGTNRFLERVFRVPAFRRAYRADLSELAAGLLRPGRLAERVDSSAGRIRPSVASEGDRIRLRFEESVAGRSVPAVGPDGSIPGRTAPPDRSGDPRPIRSFAAVRHASIVQQLEGRDSGLLIGADAGAVAGSAPSARLAEALSLRLDVDRDGTVGRKEMAQEVEDWMGEWTGSRSGILRLETLSAGLRRLAGESVSAGEEAVEFLARRILSEFDLDRSGALSRSEFSGGFLRWYSEWDPAGSGRLPRLEWIRGLAAKGVAGY
jgi:hypothetical protein